MAPDTDRVLDRWLTGDDPDDRHARDRLIATAGGDLTDLARRVADSFLGRCVRRFMDMTGIDRSMVLASQAFTSLIPLLILIATWAPADEDNVIADVHHQQVPPRGRCRLGGDPALRRPRQRHRHREHVQRPAAADLRYVVHRTVPADVPGGVRAGEGRHPERRLLDARARRAAGRGLRAVRRAGGGRLPPAQLADHPALRDRHGCHPLDLDPLPAAQPPGALAAPRVRRSRRCHRDRGVLRRQHHLHAGHDGALHPGVRSVRRHHRPHRLAAGDRLHPGRLGRGGRPVRLLPRPVGARRQDQVQAGGPRHPAARSPPRRTCRPG